MTAVPGVLALDAPPVALLLEHSADAASVLDHRYIFVESTGRVDVDFDDAMAVFSGSNVLTTAQEAYQAMLPSGETAEFTIEPCGSNRWYFINRKAQRSDVSELHRHAPSPDRLDLVYFACGERFFGEFRSLIHIRASRSDEDTVAYRADVYAYPANPVVRFFTRQLNLVERFFNRKTEAITGIITDIACYLTTPQGDGAPSPPLSESANGEVRASRASPPR